MRSLGTIPHPTPSLPSSVTLICMLPPVLLHSPEDTSAMLTPDFPTWPGWGCSSLRPAFPSEACSNGQEGKGPNFTHTNVLLHPPTPHPLPFPADHCSVAGMLSRIHHRLPVVLYLDPFLSTMKSVYCKRTTDAIGNQPQLPQGLSSSEFRN